MQFTATGLMDSQGRAKMEITFKNKNVSEGE
jgi:hypothetical protein